MEQEAKLYKLFKIRIYFVSTIQLCIGILPFFQAIELKYIVIAQTSTFIATLALCAQEYVFGSMTFIVSMYKLHRYEFKRHVVRFTVLMAAIVLSLISSLIGFYFITVVSSCLVTQTQEGMDEKIEHCFHIFSV